MEDNELKVPLILGGAFFVTSARGSGSMVEEFVRGVCLLTRVCVVSICQRSRKPNTERKLALGLVEALPIFAVTQRTLCVKEEESVTARFYFRF